VNRGFILSALTMKIKCTLSTITTKLSSNRDGGDQFGWTGGWGKVFQNAVPLGVTATFKIKL
jgi:hypothetical protein